MMKLETPTTAEHAAMARARELALHGPRTGPNPQVGCVLLTAEGATVSEGWHEGTGTPHAEIMALEAARNSGVATNGLTAVVTLEPCVHTGKTGPCVQALLDAGITRVVYSVADPGRDSGGGGELLQKSGVSVVAGVDYEEGTALIERWHTATLRQSPWVTAKWAMSLDGRTAAADGSSQWITGQATREKVHHDRFDHDVIVVGTTTVLVDDPSLTARTPDGALAKTQPRAVVVGHTEIPVGAKVRDHPGGFSHVTDRNLDTLLGNLFIEGVRSVYVEGGPTLVSAFISSNSVDEFHITMGPLFLGGPHTATTDIGVMDIESAKKLTILDSYSLDNDLVVIARPQVKEK